MRLWPMSRKNYPKQFLKLYSDKSLLQETYLRARAMMPAKNIFIVTDKINFFTAIDQLRETEPEFDKNQVLVEPESLDTAPAMAFAVKHLAENVRVDLEAPIIVLSSDHYIADAEAYLNVVRTALAFVGDRIGVIGIKPDAAKTGLGYILKGEKRDVYFEALGFREKPDKKTAHEYAASGKYVWNSGIYVFNTRTFIREMHTHAPELYAYFIKNFSDFLKEYADIPPASFPVSILEKTKNIAIFEGDFGWNDIGSFDALAEIAKKDDNPRHINIDSKNVFMHSDSNRVVATLGIEDVNIIETADSILVQKRGRSEDIKKIIAQLKERGLREIEHNLIVHRPWGKYEILIESPFHKVKKTTLRPGAKLNIQSHYHRFEHWVVVKGIAKVLIDGKEAYLRENESTFVPSLIKHRMENPGKTNLEIIEVQTGDYLSEDDTITYNEDGTPVNQTAFKQK